MLFYRTLRLENLRWLKQGLGVGLAGPRGCIELYRGIIIIHGEDYKINNERGLKNMVTNSEKSGGLEDSHQVFKTT